MPSMSAKESGFFVRSSFPPPFIDVQRRLSVSVCRLKHLSSEGCGYGPTISDTLQISRLGLQVLVPGCCSWAWGCTTGVGKVCLPVFVPFPLMRLMSIDAIDGALKGPLGSCSMANARWIHAFEVGALRAHVWVVADSLVCILCSIMIDTPKSAVDWCKT